jgi:hypothetical protein
MLAGTSCAPTPGAARAGSSAAHRPPAGAVLGERGLEQLDDDRAPRGLPRGRIGVQSLPCRLREPDHDLRIPRAGRADLPASPRAPAAVLRACASFRHRAPSSSASIVQPQRPHIRIVVS